MSFMVSSLIVLQILEETRSYSQVLTKLSTLHTSFAYGAVFLNVEGWMYVQLSENKLHKPKYKNYRCIYLFCKCISEAC